MDSKVWAEVFTGLSAIVQVILAAGLDGKEEQLAVNSSPMR